MNYAVRGFVSGFVQGVGFRNHVKQQASVFQLGGHAMNLSDGRVEVLLVGLRDHVVDAQKAVAEGPRYARVDNVSWEVVEEPIPGSFKVG